MYVVIDADGLYLVQNEPDVVKGNQKAVLTPNVVEFERLCKALVCGATLRNFAHLIRAYYRR